MYLPFDKSILSNILIIDYCFQLKINIIYLKATYTLFFLYYVICMHDRLVKLAEMYHLQVYAK